MMKVRVIGCGEAFDTGLGNNSFLLSATGRGGTVRVLVDCGYQIPERLWAHRLHRGIDAIYLTHTHADHAFGIVPLLTRYREERRTRPLVLIGHRGVESFVGKALDLGFPGIRNRIRFPLSFVVARPAQPLEWSGLAIRTARSAHSVMNLSVRFEHAGRSCAFSGDGAITPETRALYAGVDVLFHELFAVRRDVPGHTNLGALRALAADIGARRIVVSHHGRRYKTSVRRAVAALDPASAAHPRWVSAEPGQVYAI